MPTYELTEDDFNGDEIDILSILQKSGLAPSRSEARRNVEQGGVSVDGNQVKDIKAVFTQFSMKQKAKNSTLCIFFSKYTGCCFLVQRINLNNPA